jgi:DNA-binding MarR family transcriptional regulator
VALEFEQELGQLAREFDLWAGVFSHPVHYRLFEIIRDEGGASRRQLLAATETSPSSVDRGLRRLMADGLIVRTNPGRYAIRRRT